MNRIRFLSGSLCALVILCGSLSAAPPTLTYLFPAGGQVGTTVDVTAGGTFGTWPVQTWTSDPAIKVACNKAKGSLRVTIAKEARPGVHYLRLYSNDGPSGLRPFIVGTLPEVRETEPNEQPGKSQELTTTAVVVNGKLDKTADVDAFTVPLKQGQTLVASLEANRVLKSPMDAILQVLSPEGFLEVENHDHGSLDPQVAFTAPKAGTYTVRIFAFPSVPSSSINFSAADTYVYRLTLTTAGFADFPLPLAVPRSRPGTVKVQGWNIPDAATTLAVSDTTGSDVAILGHAALANSVPVRLESVPTLATPPTTPLEPPFVVTGRVTKPGEAFTVRVAAKKGQSFAILAESPSLGLPLVPLIRVLDSTGAAVGRAEPTKPADDTKYTFRPTADGTYTIEIRDLFHEGSPRHAFLLRVGSPPDFTVTCPTDRLYVAPGKPLEVKLAITRQSYKNDITVKAVDLPKGVTMEVVPAAKPDPAAITVRFSAEKPTPGGSFRLVATSKDTPPLTRTARATDADLGETTADLWIVATEAAKPPPVPKKKR